MLLWDNIFAITVHVFKIKLQSSSFKTQKTGPFFGEMCPVNEVKWRVRLYIRVGIYVFIYNFLKKTHLLK